MNPKVIGSFISDLRKSQGLTQLELAEKLNVSNRTISKWENGDGFPDITILTEIANVLGVTVDELLAGEKKQINKQETMFECEFTVDKKDMLSVFRTYSNNKSPKWMVVSTIFLCIVLFVTGIILYPYYRFVSEFVLIYSVFVILTLLLSKCILPILQSSAYIHDRIAMGDDYLITKLEVSDKLYFITKTSTQEVEYSSVSAVLENKNFLIIKCGKGHILFIKKDSFTKGNVDGFTAFINSKINPLKQDRIKKKIQIIATVISISMAISLMPLDIIIFNMSNKNEVEIIEQNMDTAIEYYNDNQDEFNATIERINSNKRIQTELKKDGVAGSSVDDISSLNNITYIEITNDYVLYEYAVGDDCWSGFIYYTGEELPHPYQFGYEKSPIDEEEYQYEVDSDTYSIEDKENEEKLILKVLDDNWYYYEFY